MGANISRQTDLSENELLKRFVDKEHIPLTDDKFWDTFLQYHIGLPTTSQEQLSLDSRLETLCQSFLSHNLASGNFGSLISIFLGKVSTLLELSDKESSRHIWQAFNALFIIRCLVKYIIETGSEFQLLQHFEVIPSYSGNDTNNDNNQQISNGGASGGGGGEVITAASVDGSKFESFFDAVVNIIVVIPVKEFTYHLHLEAVNTIIVLFSMHLFTPQPSEKFADKSIIFRTIYKNQNANTLMGALLHFVSRMVEAPATMFGFSTGSSFVFGIADTIMSIFTFRKSNTDFLTAGHLPDAFKLHYPLANQSLLLILILTHHCSMKTNPYRISLFGCSDSQADTPKNGSTFKIDFGQLYNTLCRIVTIDQATLLLYLLLHRNQRFYKYVMAQQSLQQLVIPILQTLYNAPDSTSHHIYMSLIVLLILSEDDSFNKSVHQIVLKNITWYTERSISEISLGGLLILVVIRTIQYNMIKMRDKYLHTNCLAALANMSGQFRSLHPYVAQRLVSLFETLAKKHARLDQQLKQSVYNIVEIVSPSSSASISSAQQVAAATGAAAAASSTSTTELIGNVATTSATAVPTTATSISDSGGHHTSIDISSLQSTNDTVLNVADISDPAVTEDMLQDLSVLEEVLRMVLEILNSCLSHQLVYCPNLVYTLLYKRHVFESFRSHHAFQDIIQNIDMVVGFFSSRLQRVQDQRGELGVNEVLEVISKGASQWSNDRLRKFPDLKFKYVEEDAPEEFFIPYIWTLVTKYGCVHFSSETIKGVTTDISC